MKTRLYIIVDISDKLMADEFPMWARLHVYWRTLPHINHLYRAASVAGPSMGCSKAKIPLPSRINKFQRLKTGSTIRRLGSTATRPLPVLNSTVRYILCTTSENLIFIFLQPERIIIEDTPPPEVCIADQDDLGMVHESKPTLGMR